MAEQIIKDERSLGDLFSELANETETLIRQEVALAQAELTKKAAKAGMDIGLITVGGAVAFVGFQAIIAAIIFGLAHFIPLWLSALIVGVVLAIAGGLIALWAWKALKSVEPVPRQTVETLKEDAKWLKNQVS